MPRICADPSQVAPRAPQFPCPMYHWASQLLAPAAPSIMCSLLVKLSGRTPITPLYPPALLAVSALPTQAICTTMQLTCSMVKSNSAEISSRLATWCDGCSLWWSHFRLSWLDCKWNCLPYSEGLKWFTACIIASSSRLVAQ